jgi:uncharacterized protein
MSNSSSTPRTNRRGHRRDPSGPWVIDTREVGRRPGSLRHYQRTIPAPAGLGLPGVIEVPDGDEVELDLRVESVMEGVLVSGTATTRVTGECSRCLDPIMERISVSVMELFAYRDSATDTSTDSDEVSRVTGTNADLVDTEPMVRDALLLALPQAPLCTEDCAGLCPDCGGKRAELGPDHRHETMDPRWAGLALRRDRLGDIEEENE